MMKIDMSLWNDGSHKWKPPAKNENHCLIFMELSRFYLTRTWNDLPNDMRIHIRQIFRKTFENVIQLAYHHILMHCDHGLIGQNTATPGPHELENWLNLQILVWRKKSWLAYSIYVINNDESIDKTYVEIWFRWFLSSVTLNGKRLPLEQTLHRLLYTIYTILHAFDGVVNDIFFILSAFELNTHPIWYLEVVFRSLYLNRVLVHGRLRISRSLFAFFKLALIVIYRWNLSNWLNIPECLLQATKRR